MANCTIDGSRITSSTNNSIQSNELNFSYKPLIAVTMSTGLQGMSVVRHLSATGKFKIRAMTRNPLSQRASILRNLPDVEIVKADLLDQKSLEESFRGVDGVFGNTTPTRNWKLFRGSMDHEYEIVQGENLVKAIASVRNDGQLKQFVFSSVCKSKNPMISCREPGHFSTKWMIEQSILLNKIDDILTILRPASYFENFSQNIPGINLTNNKITGVVHPDAPWQTIAVDDVGLWTKAAFLNPNEFLRKSLNIAGEEMTGNEMARVLESLQLQKKVSVNYVQVPRFLINIIENDIGIMASWIENGGYGADLSKLKEIAKKLRIEMTSLSSWLQSKLSFT